jgi:tetraacyldisaccharide 4'-kinase
MNLRRASLWAGEQLFRAGVACRDGLYQARLLPVRRLDRPVISVGNLTVGGTGKTPLVIYLCRLLSELGWAPAILSRGYGGTAERSTVLVSDGQSVTSDWRVSGDEPRMLAELLPGVPVAVGADRLASSRLLERRLPAPHRIFVLDDGFQHRRLGRTVDLVVWDSTVPLDGLRLLPAGPLREPLRALRRADAILLTRCHQTGNRLPNLLDRLHSEAPGVPVYPFQTVLADYRDLADGAIRPLRELTGQKAVVLAALGNPRQFLHDLGRSGLRVLNEFIFPDHHPFRQEEVNLIVERSRRLGADFLLTTEKDAVRLAQLDLQGFPCQVLRVRFESSREEEFRRWLLQRLPALEGG